MKVLIVGLIVLALGVAGVSTYLIKSFSSKEAISELEKEAEPPKIRVLVAIKDLAPGEVLKPDAMKWVPWPDEAINKKYIVIEKDDQMQKRQKELVDSIVRIAIKEGEPLLVDKMFKREKAGFMAGLLNPGMRAISMEVTVNTAVSGFILPNDRVDVLLVHKRISDILKDALKDEKRLENERKKEKEAAAKAKQAKRAATAKGDTAVDSANAGEPAPDEPQSENARRVDRIISEIRGDNFVTPEMKKLLKEAFPPTWYINKTLGSYVVISGTTETILKNIRVIAINQTVTPPEGNSIPAKTVTLELTPKQTEIVTSARSMGKLSLVLRGIGPEAEDPSPKTSTTDVDVSPLLSKFKQEHDELQKGVALIRDLLRRKRAQEALMSEEKPQQSDADSRQLATAPVPAAAPIAPIAPTATAPDAKKKPKKKAKKPVVKIYRGGAAKTEEIQTQ